MLVRHAESTNNASHADRLQKETSEGQLVSTSDGAERSHTSETSGGLATTTPTGGVSFDVMFASQLDKKVERADDPPLTVKGRGQAQVTAKYLHNIGEVDEIWVSPMLRTCQTAEPIAKSTGAKVRVMPDLHEIVRKVYRRRSLQRPRPPPHTYTHMQHGAFSRDESGNISVLPGRTVREIEEAHDGFRVQTAYMADPGNVGPDTGYYEGRGFETESGCIRRAEAVASRLAEHAAQARETCVVVVAHGIFFSKLVTAMIGGHMKAAKHLNCAITRFDMGESGDVMLSYLNNVAHLEPHPELFQGRWAVDLCDAAALRTNLVR